MNMKSIAMMAAVSFMATSIAYVTPAMADDMSTNGQSISSQDGSSPDQGQGPSQNDNNLSSPNNDMNGNAMPGNMPSGNGMNNNNSMPSNNNNDMNSNTGNDQGSPDTATGDDDY